MEKAETITREEAGKIFVTLATNIRHGVLNEIQALHNKLFLESPSDNELYMIWKMASSGLDYIMILLNDTLTDIEAGQYLPRQKEGVGNGKAEN